MPFDSSFGCHSQSVRISVRVIDVVYGRDNHDNAGDDMVYCLRVASDFPEQYQAEFNYDTKHANPHYHVMVCTIYGITELHYNRMIELLAAYKLVEGANA